MIKMKFHDKEYLRLVDYVFKNGIQKGDRTGTGTLSTFAPQMRFDLSNDSIPLLTTKKMHTKSIIHELLWFLAGDTNVKYLQDNKVRIWNEWADADGNLGPIYGHQWRKWEKIEGATVNYLTDPLSAKLKISHIDQIANVIDTLRNNPNDRRIIVNAWNVGQLDSMALPPCHCFFQFWSSEVNGRRELSCHLYQRSCDVGLGVPFNIAQYSILIHMVAQVTGHVAREFIWTGGDTHIYINHIEQLNEQLTRDPLPSPTLKLNSEIKEIDDFTFDDFSIENYESYPTIKMDVSV